MSTWKWGGSYFPSQEDIIAPASIGDGTAYPVTWDRTDGATTPDQMCQFEWTTKEITLSLAGSVTLVFTDYTGGGAPDTPKTTAFSRDVVTTVTGTDWSVREVPNGSDYAVGGISINGVDNTYSIPVTLPWGPDSFNFVISFSASLLFGVDGTQDGAGNFVSYVKDVNSTLACSTGGAPPYSAVGASTNSGLDISISGLTITAPLTTDQGAQTVFHGSPHVWSGTGGTGAAGCSISFTTFSLLVTDKFNQPADI